MSRGWRLAALGVGWWVVGMLLWLLLTSTVAWNEVLTGVAAAAVGALTVVAVHAHERIAAHPRLGWVRFVLPLPRRIAADTWFVTRALAARLRGRRIRGRYIELRVTRSADASERRARQAATTVITSMAPNHYVVDFDEERGVVLVHELVRRGHDSFEELMLGS